MSRVFRTSPHESDRTSHIPANLSACRLNQSAVAGVSVWKGSSTYNSGETRGSNRRYNIVSAGGLDNDGESFWSPNMSKKADANICEGLNW
jgi:hypothetical protein